jgi:hypothetical protein
MRYVTTHAPSTRERRFGGPAAVCVRLRGLRCSSFLYPFFFFFFFFGCTSPRVLNVSGTGDVVESEKDVAPSAESAGRGTCCGRLTAPFLGAPISTVLLPTLIALYIYNVAGVSFS